MTHSSQLESVWSQRWQHWASAPYTPGECHLVLPVPAGDFARPGSCGRGGLSACGPLPQTSAWLYVTWRLEWCYSQAPANRPQRKKEKKVDKEECQEHKKQTPRSDYNSQKMNTQPVERVNGKRPKLQKMMAQNQTNRVYFGDSDSTTLRSCSVLMVLLELRAEGVTAL